jgi:nucleotide-binding universal stress UspA family protein
MAEVDGSPGFLVVGVDGSESSRRALEWALEESRLRKLELTAIGVVQIHLVALSVPGYPYADERYIDDLLADTQKLVANQVDQVGPGPEVKVTSRAVLGSPAEVLVDASAQAEMLVVGSRGRGGFSGLLLGSVSQQCVSHARCPVVVMRPRHQ